MYHKMKPLIILIGNKERESSYDIIYPFDVFCRKNVLKNFSNFTGKYLGSILLLVKLRAVRPENLSKRDTNTGSQFFLWILIIF